MIYWRRGRRNFMGSSNFMIACLDRTQQDQHRERTHLGGKMAAPKTDKSLTKAAGITYAAPVLSREIEVNDRLSWRILVEV
jgi:hypothetical protein